LSWDNVRLEVITEFLEAPGAIATTEVLSRETDPQKRQDMVLPDFIDQNFNFGAMNIGKGKAFDFQGVLGAEVSVGKTWEIRNGRTFLIEAVQFPSVQAALKALPQKQAKVTTPARTAHASILVPPKGSSLVAGNKNRLEPEQTVMRPFPAAPRQRAAADRRPMQRMAQIDLKHGLLLDYSLDLASGQTNQIFAPGGTFHILGPVDLYETTTFMGGTVVKFSPESTAENFQPLPESGRAFVSLFSRSS